MTKKNWHIFVIFHKNLIDDHYLVDPSFTHENYTFIKCNEQFKADYNQGFGYNILQENSFEYYDKTLQQRKYHAPSAIYHVYKNKLYENYDYVGFLEYDILLKSDSDSIPDAITNYISEVVEHNAKLVMSFSIRHSFKNLSDQHKIKINGVNAMSQIVSDYNDFFGTSYLVDRLLVSNELVSSQQSFLLDKATFENVMGFIAFVIENKLAEKPDSWQRPSTLLERYFGMSLLFEEKQIPLPLIHSNMQQWSYPKTNLWSRFLKLFR